MKFTEKTDPRENANDDPREQDGEKSAVQNKTPWKQNPQNATDPSLPDTSKPDLENWQDSKTH